MSGFAGLDKEIEEARKKQSKGRFSETASAHRQSAWTPAQNKLGAAISNLRSIPFSMEACFLRPGEFTNDGVQKSYRVDVLLLPLAPREVALEAEGKGTSSDDPERDEFFRQHEIKVVHIPNSCAKQFGYVLADLIDALYWALAKDRA